MRAGGAVLFSLLVPVAVPRLAAQSPAPRPAIVVVNLRFDGEHANVLSPGDTAVVAAAVAAEEAGGNPCDNDCALAVARRLGARWVAKGTISNLSNLVWLLTAELFDATTGKPVLADSYEIKGDAKVMAPAGAHVFAQRVEKTIGGAR